MCLFGKQKSIQPSESPSPSPSPTATEVEPQITADQRRKRIAAMASYGMRSTIKTSPQGVTGFESLYTSANDKKTLGS